MIWFTCQFSNAQVFLRHRGLYIFSDLCLLQRNNNDDWKTIQDSIAKHGIYFDWKRHFFFVHLRNSRLLRRKKSQAEVDWIRFICNCHVLFTHITSTFSLRSRRPSSVTDERIWCIGKWRNNFWRARERTAENSLSNKCHRGNRWMWTRRRKSHATTFAFRWSTCGGCGAKFVLHFGSCLHWWWVLWYKRNFNL